jgi:hypothetical protein
VVVGEHPRFLWCARAAPVCRCIGGREDGLVAVHFDDDLGIAGDFTGVEGTHADHCSRGDIVSVCGTGGTRFREGDLPTLMLSAMVPDGGCPPPQQLRIRLSPLSSLWLCGCCYALAVFVWDRGVIYGVLLCGCCLCEALSRKQDPSGRKFNAGDPAVQNFGLQFSTWKVVT